MAAQNPTDLPRQWIDPDTGHKVVRLSDEPETASLYFHQNAYTPDGKTLMIHSPTAIYAVNLSDFKLEKVYDGKAGVIMVGHKTGKVYFTDEKKNLCSLDMSSKQMKVIAPLPANTRFATINCDETLAAGIFDDNASTASTTAEAKPKADSYVGKGQMMENRLAERRPISIVTFDLQSQQTKTLLRGIDWYNHLQFSPTDPGLLMYCHEGPWHKVDRTWLIRTDGSAPLQVHHRTMNMEIEGHEWFAQDGKTVWYDLQTPKSEVFWVAGYEIASGKRTWFSLSRSEWSVHFNTSPDGKLFAGDGGGPRSVAAPGNGQWIYLFKPEMRRDETDGQLAGSDKLIQPGMFRSEKLVNLAKHDYGLEPNVTFTPDMKWIVFRSNMFGPTHVFAVQVQK